MHSAKNNNRAYEISVHAEEPQEVEVNPQPSTFETQIWTLKLTEG